jgi:hypothetical protein
VIARLPNYRFDPPFAGLFDPNPYFDPEQDLLPKTPPRIRLYERPPAPPRTPRPAALLPAPSDAVEDQIEAKAMSADPFLDRLLEGWGSDRHDRETSGA